MKNASNSGICKETIFSDFFKNHVKALRNYLIYKFGNMDQAEDATQEAFIKLWQNCDKVTIETAKSYLYTVANNTSLNVIAHQKVVLAYEKKADFKHSTNESPEFILEEEQFKIKLLNAIDKLNELNKVAFLMHRIDGKKYAQIAAELNITVKAVERRIHLALIELRKEFTNFK